MGNGRRVSVQELNRFQLPAGFRGRSAVVVQLWWLTQATLFRLSPQFLYGWRSMLLRLFGARVGRGVKIRPAATVTYPWKFEIGDFSWVGDDAVIYCLGDVKIGRNAVVSQRSYLCAGDHDPASVAFEIRGRPIVIEDEAWVCADVFVAPGVTIARGAVIGARSSVFKDMPSDMICTGHPCVPIKRRTSGN
ncbi:putative colanic acid biosynthesis acetyltransferase [Paraburkholderia phenazinium]|uniref:Putative colanic acid biosynthesis acetyltransferase WcaF n=1 Tax=Paraburkholderia phenazinium TaxID=60549 RepID=A0A1G7S8R9_9BURK|nr:putative colanic acid biosynthesis acetyltransferase [Paraburkholderia phenazinium]SDG18829.1 putative colanic acid biosynthesis acetyltransferase WcaF [Paraburkholderia phenazinium]